MASYSLAVCVSFLLVQGAFSKPYLHGHKAHNVGTPLATSVIPSRTLSGTVSQLVAPTETSEWRAGAHTVPLITEIEPNLQVGEITATGEMPIFGSIKISGMFPVFGSVGVDGSLPTYGTAYVDVGNVGKECS